jgi:hypothetical protein
VSTGKKKRAGPIVCHLQELPADKVNVKCICYASANIKALETLGYAEHICNFFVILDSWFYGKDICTVDWSKEAGICDGFVQSL